MSDHIFYLYVFNIFNLCVILILFGWNVVQSKAMGVLWQHFKSDSRHKVWFVWEGTTKYFAWRRDRLVDKEEEVDLGELLTKIANDLGYIYKPRISGEIVSYNQMVHREGME